MSFAAGLAGYLRTGFGKAFGATSKAVTTAGQTLSANVGSHKLGGNISRFAKNLGLQTGVGVAAAIATDDPNYILTGAAMGAVGGVASMFRSQGANSLMWAKRMIGGQAIGALSGNPMMGPVGTLGIVGVKKFGGAIAGGVAKGTVHAPGYALNLARAPFAPMKALRYVARESHPMATPLMLGLLGGIGAATVKMSTNGASRDAIDSTFMGGTAYAGVGGRVMGFNHLETAGLTLAIHNRGRGSRVVR